MHHPIVVVDLPFDLENPDFHENMKNHGRNIEVEAKGYEKRWKKMKILI